MAKTTINDCIEHCPNHFELVIGAAERARMLLAGHSSELPVNNDKQIVLALREIAAGTYKVDLEATIIRSIGERTEVHDSFYGSRNVDDSDGFPHGAGGTPHTTRR